MAKKKRNKWLTVGIPILAVLIIAAFVYVNVIKKKDINTDVTVAKAKMGRLVQTVPGTGRVQPEVQVKISANVSAKITALKVKEGDLVNAGDLLVTLDKEQFEAAVEQSISTLKSAEAALSKAKSERERIQELFKKGMASQSDLEGAEANYQLTTADLERSRAYLKQSKDQLAKTSIYAPMPGIVSQLNKELGEIALGAQFSQDVIMTVADLNKMEVEVEVDENDVVNISLQDTAKIRIDAFPDTTFRGLVREIAHTAITRGLGTQEEITNFQVKITLLDIPAGLRPGMSATADVITDVRENALSIPIQCVVLKPALKPKDSGKDKKGIKEAKATVDPPSDSTKMANGKEKLLDVVFIMENGKAKQVEVKTGISSDTDIEVLSGLKEGETIVTGPFRTLTQKLKDGDAVKEKEEASFGSGDTQGKSEQGSGS
jgi:HlyD family secretion protein